MNKLSSAILAALIIFSLKTLSQESLLPDSVRTGVSYKFVLYNDTEIIGKVTRHDSIYINVSGDDGLYRLKKEDIFFISRNLVKNRFDAVVSLGGGLSFISSSDGSYDNNEFKPRLALQVAALFPLGENKGIRIDAGFSSWRREEYLYEQFYNQGYEKFGAQNKECYTLKGDFVYGLISPQNRFWIYGTAGLGINYLVEGPQDHESSYYNSYDSTYQYYKYHYDGENQTGVVLSIGCAMGYRFSREFGVYADVQLNTLTNHGFFPFFWGGSGSYIPVKAGLTYIIY